MHSRGVDLPEFCTLAHVLQGIARLFNTWCFCARIMNTHAPAPRFHGISRDACTPPRRACQWAFNGTQKPSFQAHRAHAPCHQSSFRTRAPGVQTLHPSPGLGFQGTGADHSEFLDDSQKTQTDFLRGHARLLVLLIVHAITPGH